MPARAVARQHSPLVALFLAIAGVLVSATLLGAGQPAETRLASAQTTPDQAPDQTPDPFGADIEPEIRVRIERDVSTLRVEGTTGPRLIIRPPEGGKGELVNGPLTVEAHGSQITVTDASGHRSAYTPRTLRSGLVSGLEIAPVAPIADDDNRRVRVNGVDNPGFLRVHLNRGRGASTLDAVAVMPVEQYIPGVIVKELYQSWPRAVFQAQAVAARSYALHQRERARNLGRTYDVESTTRDQAFAGATTLRTAIAAADTTRGIVLTDKGDLLRAYYSSTCGGLAASAADTFPTGEGYRFNLAPPIQAHERVCPCQDSPRYRWTRSRATDNLAKRLRAWGQRANMNLAQLGQIKVIKVESLNPVGRPRLYRIDDDLGRTYFVPAETFRVAANYDAPGLPPISDETRIISSDFQIDMLGAETHFRGEGFGHGVGMCQWGAKKLADTGWDWRSILEHYYPGATINKAY